MATGGDNRSSSDVIGVLFGVEKLDGCRAVQTLFGRVRYQHASVPVVDGNITDALGQLLSELALASSRYQSPRRFQPKNATLQRGRSPPVPRVRLHVFCFENHCEAMRRVSIKWRSMSSTGNPIGERSQAFAPIPRIEAIRTAVAESNQSLQRLEPAAACLIGVSPEREGRERRNSLITRVLLGDSKLLAVMSRGAKPIHWQRLPLPPGDEATGIVSAIRSIETAASACGLDRTPDSVVIHGRPELQALTDQQWLSESLGGSFRWVETPTLLGRDVAQALADRLLSSEDEGFDLVRQHRDLLQLRRVVPYKEIVAYLVAACVLAGVLWLQLGAIEDQHTALVSGAPPMVGGGSNPNQEKEQLSARASSVSQFLEKRVRWSGVLGEITQSLPAGMRLTEIHGSAPMGKRRNRQMKLAPSTLILRAECALGEDGSMPESLESLAESLHELDTVKPHFDSVELSDVRRTRSQDTGVAGAEFSVIFTAKTKGGR